MNCEFKLVSSLEKSFLDRPENMPETRSGSMLKNEVYSFQLLCWADVGEQVTGFNCKVKIQSALAPYLRVFSVGFVPSLLPAYPSGTDEDYLTKTPGLFPDPLFPLGDGTFQMMPGQTRALWFTVEPEGNITGEFPIDISVYDPLDVCLGSVRFTLRIIDAELPKLDIYNTCWFHGDCLAVLHGMELQSDAYFELVEKYLRVYVAAGHNTILTPAFTPPLDTDVGGERPTNQLVGVTVTKGAYSFDFSLLRRWIKLCEKQEIEFFEISHFYSQWGAKYAPKIMATVDGRYGRIFGWDTDALGEDYRAFLEAFLPQLTAFLKEEGVYTRCLFHVSDEPSAEQAVQYEKAKGVLTKYIDEDQIIDALGDYRLYESGAVRHPVVSLDHMKTFREHGVTDLWGYYCCVQGDKVANRFMAMPSYRNRVLGCQLYKFNIRGFLQWGFNFWFSARSRRVLDPACETDAGCAFPSGDAFVVYPLSECGEPICSLRLYVFREAMQDYRALTLLERLAGRNAVESLLTEIADFENYPRTAKYYLHLRQKVNEIIETLAAA